MVHCGDLAGDFVRLVEGRRQRSGEAEPGGDSRQGGEDGRGVRPADDVTVQDQPRMFPKPEPLGEEDEVEFATLRRVCHVLERSELDLAARTWIAPHRQVVYAWKCAASLICLVTLLPRSGEPPCTD
jgi:hypothetical protein